MLSELRNILFIQWFYTGFCYNVKIGRIKRLRERSDLDSGPPSSTLSGQTRFLVIHLKIDIISAFYEVSKIGRKQSTLHHSFSVFQEGQEHE